MEKVNHPEHYKAGKFEAIDIIEAYSLNFCLGNTLKYLLRAGRKSKEEHLTDLEKAHWYLEREIERIKNESNEPKIMWSRP